ncbi:MAG: T9SS type A sorting domain-containing protein [Bacteroidetes bacterium]|nr:T9SS type A sorting domain-containing protein [Bacteroidota bacterium]
MKTKLTLLAVLVFCSFQSRSQLVNGGFENWTNFGTYSDPEHWFSFNYVTSNFGVLTCEEGTPGNPGAKYVKLISKDIPGIGVMAGSITSGEYISSTGQYINGIPFSQRPASFTGSWQYVAGAGDMGAMYVMLTKWNPSLGGQDLVAVTSTDLTGTITTWTNFDLPFSYLNSDTPDSATIYFTASGAGTGGPVDGSYIYLDNLAFTGTATGITTGPIPVVVEVYPNPAKQFVFVDQSNPAKETKYEINSLDGKSVQTGTIYGIKSKIEFNDLKPGVYFVNLINDGVKTVKRIVISE